jgi:hypothetical protein
MGGKLMYDDDQETPNTQMATFDWGDGVVGQFEVRGLLTGPEGNLSKRGANTIGNLFYGSDGWMNVDANGFQVYKGEDDQKVMDEKKAAEADTVPHMQNFVDAVKSRKYQDLHAEIEIGARAAALCHMANIAYRVNRRLQFDDAKRQFVSDGEANRMMTRDYRKPYVVPEKV